MPDPAGPRADYRQRLQPAFRKAFGRRLPEPSMSPNQAALLGDIAGNLQRYRSQLVRNGRFSPLPQVVFDLQFLWVNALRPSTQGHFVVSYTHAVHNLWFAAAEYLEMLHELRTKPELLERVHFSEPAYVTELISDSGSVVLPTELNTAFKELPNDLDYSLAVIGIILDDIEAFAPAVTQAMMESLAARIRSFLPGARKFQETLSNQQL